MQHQHAIKADYFLYGIQAGIISFQDAIYWADKIIEVEDVPCVEIIDLALSKSRGRNEVMNALKGIPGKRDPQLSGSYLLGDLKQLLFAGGDLKDIAHKAMNVAAITQQPDDDYFRFIAIDDGIALAEAGVYNTLAQCREDLRQVLSQYKAWNEV